MFCVGTFYLLKFNENEWILLNMNATHTHKVPCNFTITLQLLSHIFPPLHHCVYTQYKDLYNPLNTSWNKKILTFWQIAFNWTLEQKSWKHNCFKALNESNFSDSLLIKIEVSFIFLFLSYLSISRCLYLYKVIQHLVCSDITLPPFSLLLFWYFK